MDILVVTNSCSQKKYSEICKNRIRAAIDPQQKFFRLLISGLSAVSEGNVVALSALPVSASTIKQKVFDYEADISDDGVPYRYLPFRNGKITRYLSLIFSAKKYTRRWCKGKNAKNSFIIVDPLVPVIAIPTRKAAQKLGIKVCAVVTDLPSLSTNMKGRKENIIKRAFLSIYQHISDVDLHTYDAYITLTKSINDVVNTNKKQNIVIEGFADSKDTEISDVHENYIMYAGGIYEKYGVKSLTEAFISLNRKDLSLYIFGEGPYVKELIKIQETNPNVRYMGCVSPEKVVDYEKRALLLVNPRPADEEFAKYSFPSKTMEYLLSGTAVASTKLPGIPEEYFKYMYSIDGFTAKEIQKNLERILAQPNHVICEMGKKGHDFVISKKNNIRMAENIYKFFREW
mgnify:CR=1 FL=1